MNKRLEVWKLIGIRNDGEFVAVDNFFDHGRQHGEEKPFRGCCGSHFRPVTKKEYDYTTSPEGLEEHLQSYWECMEDEGVKRSYGPDLVYMRGYKTRKRELERATNVADQQRVEEAEAKMEELKASQMELAFKEFCRQVFQNDGDEAIYDLSYCSSGVWEQIREAFPDTMGEDKVELFECTGGGRCFQSEYTTFEHWMQGWTTILDPDMLDWIVWWERGGFTQYKTGILGELNKIPAEKQVA